jgi:hypothetical protein
MVAYWHARHDSEAGLRHIHWGGIGEALAWELLLAASRGSLGPPSCGRGGHDSGPQVSSHDSTACDCNPGCLTAATTGGRRGEAFQRLCSPAGRVTRSASQQSDGVLLRVIPHPASRIRFSSSPRASPYPKSTPMAAPKQVVAGFPFPSLPPTPMTAWSGRSAMLSDTPDASALSPGNSAASPVSANARRWSPGEASFSGEAPTLTLLQPSSAQRTVKVPGWGR